MYHLYHSEITDHYKRPRYTVPLASYTVQNVGTNVSCGDKVFFGCLIENGIVEEVCLQAQGCVITVATASLLAQFIVKKTIVELRLLTPDIVQSLIKLPLGPVRLKCALLPFDTIMQGLQMIDIQQ